MIPRHLQITFGILVVSVVLLVAYLFNLQSRTEERAHAPTATTVPPSSKTENVPVVIAYDQAGVLRRSRLSIPVRTVSTERIRMILQSVVEEYTKPKASHTLGAGSEVTEVLLVNSRLAVINVNSAFAEEHPSGIGSETLTVASLVDTVAANLPGIEQVKFLVDGKPRDTLAGHADLTQTYNVAAVQQALPVSQ